MNRRTLAAGAAATALLARPAIAMETGDTIAARQRIFGGRRSIP